MGEIVKKKIVEGNSSNLEISIFKKKKWSVSAWNIM